LQKEQEGDCAQSRIAQPGDYACKVIFNFIEIKGKCDHGQTVQGYKKNKEQCFVI